MNEQQTFERIVADSVSDLGPLSPSDGAIERTLSRVDQKRQRPRWLTLIKEPPMRTNDHLAVGSPTVRVVAIMAATILLAVALAGAGIAGQQLLAAGPIIVAQDGSGTVETLAEGIAMADDGEEILVRPGTYAESVIIDKAISISGDGSVEEIVISGETGPIMLIEADTTLTRLTFTGPDSDGVLVLGATVLLKDLVFAQVGKPFAFAPCPDPCTSTSLRMDEGTTAVVRDSTFKDGGQLAAAGGSLVEIYGNTLAGGPHISAWELATGSEISNNYVSDNLSRGIGLYEPTDVLVSGNTITNTPEFGIVVGWETGPGVNPRILTNTISGATYGIDIANGANPALEGNALFDNEVGVLVRGSDPLIRGNDLSANDTSIAVRAGSPHLDQNTISLGSVGLAISSAATPVLTENSICDNATNVQLSGEAAMPDITGNTICEDPESE